jgi:hypothetical protein
MADPVSVFSLSRGVVFAVFSVLAAGGAVLFFFGRKWWAGYVEERETLYQPHILMAIADEEGGRLGPIFHEERRMGDWTIVENALFKWSAEMTGFARQGFCRIFDKNGFGDVERDRLSSLRASTRARAARRIGRMVYFPAIGTLLPLLNDRSPEVRRNVSWALAKLGQADATGMVVTSQAPETVREASGESTGTIVGRFLWEDGTPLIIGNDEETNYLVHKVGGLDGDARIMPGPLPGGNMDQGGPWKTYHDGFRLTGARPGRPAGMQAVLKQGVEDYYAVLHRRRENIRVEPGSVTENVDFVFPRFKDPDDRLSVKGVLELPEELPESFRGVRLKTVVSLRGERGFYSGYMSYKRLTEFRIHDVPPGKYKIRAVVAAFVYEGELTVGQSQPLIQDLTLNVPRRG